MAFVVLDTQILIWGGIRGHPRDQSDQPDLADRCKILLSRLERDEMQIVVPTICAAELAVPIMEKKRGHFLATLSENFLIKPFDLHAAGIAADHFARTLKLPKDDVPARKVLSADVKIIATAKAAGAKIFYSHDEKCRNVAKLIMEGRDLPSHREELF